MWCRLMRWLGIASKPAATTPTTVDQSADPPSATNNEAPAFKAINITSGSISRLSNADLLRLREIDSDISDIISLYRKDVDGYAREQLHALSLELLDRVERVNRKISSSPFVAYEGELIREIEKTAEIVRIKTQPLIEAADGCKIIAIVDTETTGIEDFDEPITIAIILIEIGMPKGNLVRVIETYQGQREPGVPINEDAYKVHGLTLTNLQGQQFDLARMELLLRSAHLVVAHNAKFDRRMLRHVLLDSNGLPWACSMLALRHIWDTRVGKRSLDAICHAMSIERDTPHNALTDAQALMSVLLQPSGKTPRSRTLLGQLVAKPWCPPP